MRVLSLGAGVQSSTLMLMATHGEIQIDCAIFADTGWEPKAVYAWLDFLAGEAAEANIPMVRVSAGNIRDDVMAIEASTRRFASMPFYVRNLDGSPGAARRQCTKEYKLEPIRRHIRSLIPGRPKPGAVDVLIGISLDEIQRMKDSRVKYIRNVYPLIDFRMTRHDCATWLNKHGYPTPPKSACIGCPFHGNATWRAMKRDHPEEFADAVAVDEHIRTLPRFVGAAYLHRQMVPLAMADVSNATDHGQQEMFGEECEGMCGV